jgi:hypothetical protein
MKCPAATPNSGVKKLSAASRLAEYFTTSANHTVKVMASTQMV